MNKKLKISLVSLASIFTLAACGQANDGGNSSKTDQNESSQEVSKETKGETASKEENQDQQESKEGNKDQAESSQDQDGIENKEYAISIEDAVNKFNEETGAQDVKIEEIEFDYEEEFSKYTYEIQGYNAENEWDMHIDPDSGEVLKVEAEKEVNDESKQIEVTSLITPKEAMEKALAEHPGEKVKNWELSVDDNGVIHYEVDLTNVDDVDVNASSGEIIP
ncbi:PepSY domain-containing protein [Aerococcus urinae]|uniref:PepSY domain-containing protein n=1 Tax=Aerococcus urinae TaxID=1376 RepID=UPI0018A7DD94|nr:PepSY domain-containing protein [Aerococcus urinae]